MIAVRIDKDGFVRDFRRIIATARRPRAVLAAAGREAANRLRAHFRARHRENPNKLGGKRQNFWLHVMRSTQSPVVDEGANTVTISITHPAFAQKVFGGTIRAKRVRNLAIPQTAEAYGRAPSVLEHEAGIKLFVLRANGRAWLAAAQDGSNLKVHYRLTPSVDQAPDPAALPEEGAFARAILARAESVLQRQLQP